MDKNGLRLYWKKQCITKEYWIITNHQIYELSYYQWVLKPQRRASCIPSFAHNTRDNCLGQWRWHEECHAYYLMNIFMASHVDGSKSSWREAKGERVPQAVLLSGAYLWLWQLQSKNQGTCPLCHHDDFVQLSKKKFDSHTVLSSGSHCLLIQNFLTVTNNFSNKAFT